MMSYIYRMAKSFNDLHGFAPNLIYLNSAHLNMLRLQLGNPVNVQEILRQLGLDVMVSQSVSHPSVAYSATPRFYKDVV